MTSFSKTRTASGTFRIVFDIAGTKYAVVPLHPDPSVARKAYRLMKLSGDQAVYDVSVDRYGPQCECLGFLRWNKPCKHIRTLRGAGMIE